MNHKQRLEKIEVWLKEPQTEFETQYGKFKVTPLMSKYIILLISHNMQDMDFFSILVGKERAGKSLLARQLDYVKWWYLTQLELIDYPFTLDLIHFGTKALREDRMKYDMTGKKHRISLLDESKDDIGRDKQSSQEAKDYIDYIRRCGEENGYISMLMPVLYEFPPKIILTRCTMIVYVKVRSDANTGELIRGDYECVIIPRGDYGFSVSQNREIPTPQIMGELTLYLYDAKRQFEPMPKRIITFKGTFENVDVIDTNAYREKKREEKWKRLQNKENGVDKKPESERLKIWNDRMALVLAQKRQGFTNKDIAHQIGVTEATIRRWLEPMSSPSTNNVSLYKVPNVQNLSTNLSKEATNDE